ncbi:MAG: hypothetical protein HQ581_29125 [Planctomycetes bacterium]|nr:hypothetical protein [Planctomycetota bacterium]
MNTTSLDNLRRLTEGGPGQWIPFTLDVGSQPGFSEPVQRTFKRLTGADSAAEYFGSDVRCFSLPVRFGGDEPSALHESVEPGTTFDEWGVGHVAADTEGTVDRMLPPLARANSPRDVEKLPPPLVDTSVDTAPIERYHAAGYPVFGYGGSVYEWAWWLRGMEEFMVDLVDNPPLAEAILHKTAAHTTRLSLATARAGIDVLAMYDDAGSQRGMQISPALWRRFVKPVWTEVLATVRSAFPHVKFFLHSCGKIDAIVPDVIECGFDILHPVQPECMAFEEVHREFGRDILLAATVSSQKVFPFGSAEEVRQAVRRLAAVAGSDRRCLLMPSNVIQPETPWSNVVAFAEEAAALRGE